MRTAASSFSPLQPRAAGGIPGAAAPRRPREARLAWSARAGLACVALLLLAPAARADCKEEILTILDRLTTGSPYRSEAVLTSNGEKLSELNSDIVPPDGMRTRQTAGEQSSEMLKIGGQIWVRRNGAWQEMPAAMAASVVQTMNDLKMRTPNLISDTECPGIRTVDGKESVVYTYLLDLPGSPSAANTLYVDPATRLPTRMVVEQRSQPKRVVDTRYTFDASIKLEPPEVGAPKPQDPQAGQPPAK